jgi:hypothetical protein
MKTRRSLMMISIALVLESLAPHGACLAQSAAPSPPSSGGAAAAAGLLKQRTAELAGALRDYRSSLERLLSLHEEALARAVDRQQPRRDLYKRGIISRRELEEGELAVTTARGKVDETRRAIETADHAAVEAAAMETLAALPPPAPGERQQTAALSRYQGLGAWSLRLDTPKLQRLFAARFGRPLPISAFGQTPMHDRMGFDHHNALDVAVQPDSPEGQVLQDYLRTEGIPFIAFRGAVPGSASGAHIHVGQPSPRIAVRR